MEIQDLSLDTVQIKHTENHAHTLLCRCLPTVLFCLGQLHEFLLFQCVHHVGQASFAALRRPEGEADHWLSAIPGKLLWLGWRGRVSPVGVDRAALTAFIVLWGEGRSKRDCQPFVCDWWMHADLCPFHSLFKIQFVIDKLSHSSHSCILYMYYTVILESVIGSHVVSPHYIPLNCLSPFVYVLFY